MKMSFLILTWNRYKFLELCLESLVASIQSPRQCEIIIMDNGSTDQTPEVLKRYATNPMVKVVVRDKNYGLNAYKKLFALAQGEYMVVVDDDVLRLPPGIDLTFIDYFQSFPDYGFIALNVIQDEFTNGARPGPERYTDDTRDGKTLEQGPTGGWCACFRRSDYRRIWLRLLFKNLSMASSEDGFIEGNFRKKLGLKSGIIKDQVCFHACGPHYAKQYGHLDREIEKYNMGGLKDYAAHFAGYRDEGDQP